MKVDFFAIVFIFLILILTVYFPISGYRGMKRLKSQLTAGNHEEKARFYHRTIAGSWVPVILVLLLIPISNVNPGDLGLKWIQIDTTSVSKWIVYPLIGFFLLYLIYLLYSLFVIKYDKKNREKVAKTIPEDTRFLLPVTPKEKQLWTRVSISAGITEEIVYRGYLFFALAVVFPSLSIIHILLITTLIFGMGHIYLGKDAIKSTFLGLLFGVFYILFDSVIPVIILHIVQDLVVRDIFQEEEILND
ncbi:CPBP family intramembrane glutamic endopeptidase [Poritiphilus flavus]|uniref:CPBP family intramembrane metalloprotease n=1 Tax=Poritiphilus flavus TaxID=2697053 RepID=A0A6L9EH18_9FLAO|nr:CPBP family intramembrane glutamic endopeptidase [Poritiphilus flavus]NAS14090.1 CPBP family intramembrane metalloprotease [Poritiphilus flavus]